MADRPVPALEEGLLGRRGQVVDFNPNQHPRDAAGRFAAVLAALRPGQKARLPGGVEVLRTRGGTLRVRRRLALQADPGGKSHDASSAARLALRLDSTPHENTRVGGRLFRAGEPLSRADAGRLARGAPVVTGGGQYGRFVALVDDPGDYRKPKRALVRFDSSDVARGGSGFTKLVDASTLRAAVPVSSDAEGSHTSPAPASPGRGALLAPAAAAIVAGPALDTLHFLRDMGELSDRQTRTIARGGVTLGELRSLDDRLARDIAVERRMARAPASPGRPGPRVDHAARLRHLLALRRALHASVRARG